ncbi:MAG: hypothetical protein HY897_21750 [Deltaproteobacteria bacterium]|nr:hypothetical protein [Deltaproteobacteria bacterium]
MTFGGFTHTISRRTTFVAAVAVLIASCGWKTDGLERLDEVFPLPDASDAGVEIPDVQLGDVGGSGLPGHWAVLFYQPGKVHPAGMDPWGITINDLFVADIDPAGTSASLTFCNQVVESESDMGLSTIPQKLIDALAASPVVIALSGGGTFGASDVAWLWGVQGLSNPVSDPLPKDKADSHVLDEDGDGNSGVTVEVKNPDGERYMVRRSVWDFKKAGLTADNNWITGELEFTVEEHALDATSALLKTVAPIEPSAKGASYVLRRVNPEYPCSSLADEWRGVFEGAP